MLDRSTTFLQSGRGMSADYKSVLARRSMSEALLLQAFRLDHLSVRTCEQSPHTWMDFYAVWGGE